MPKFLYSAALYLLLPFTPIKLLWRGLRQREYLQHWAERYGLYQTPTNQQPLIWLHCVSVGETRAAEPLIHALLKQYPGHQILLSHTTPTGRDAGLTLFPPDTFNRVQRCYLPYDVPGAVRRFLNHYQPQLGLLMETELWFNLIHACNKKNIPLLLINARLSAHSAHGYAKTGSLVSRGLNQLRAIAAQTKEDAERIADLMQIDGQPVSCMGNLKFDVSPPEDAIERGLYLRSLLGLQRPIFLAASTREGEEALILDALAQANIPNLLTVIVPRHPQRFDEVATLLSKRNISFCRRSEFSMGTVAGDIPSNSVILGDSMGEMFMYYVACDVAFIGGSLLPLGGQNLIEACTMSKPVIIGPHTFNFEDASKQAIDAGAAIRVKNQNDLADQLAQLMEQPEKIKEMGKAALAFSKQARGATDRALQLVKKYLPN
jgi:3-deoxy-D-manno-octulosonic-acid transferase